MKKLLHIIATPRGAESRTLLVSRAFLESFASTHPQWDVETLELFREGLPELTAKRVDGKYLLLCGKELSGESKKAWEDIVVHIGRFKSADGYLVSAPMWNFGIPYILKHYIDVILQPGYLFRYTATGVEGLVKGKKAVVITSRGGDYRDPLRRGLDMQEPYLRGIFGFIGIADPVFVNAQPMDMGIDLKRQMIEAARLEARRVAEGF